VTTITDLMADEIRAKLAAADIPLIGQLGDTIADQLLADSLSSPGDARIAASALMETAGRLQIMLTEAKELGAEIQAQFLLNVMAAAGERLWHRTTRVPGAAT
jgi:hypothetical protein